MLIFELISCGLQDFIITLRLIFRKCKVYYALITSTKRSTVFIEITT